MTQENKSFIHGLIVACLVGLATIFASLIPKADAAVLVFTNPFSDQTSLTLVAAADGELVSDAADGTFFIAKRASNDDARFVENLYRNGALLVLSAQGFVACFYPNLNRPISEQSKVTL